MIRHAKAEQAGPTDHARVLSARGHADAEAAGAWLAAEGITPQVALVSAATRARQTWAALAQGAGWELEATYDEGLYSADPETAMDLVRLVPDDVHTVVVVGHNPTMASLAQLLDDGSGDEAAGREMMSGFPTSAVAVLEHVGDWGALDVTSARLVGFHVGRG